MMPLPLLGGGVTDVATDMTGMARLSDQTYL